MRPGTDKSRFPPWVERPTLCHPRRHEMYHALPFPQTQTPSIREGSSRQPWKFPASGPSEEIGNHPSRYLIAVYLCCPRSLPRWPFLPHSSGIQQGNGLSWAIPVVVHPTNSAKRVIRKPVRRKPESEGKFFVRKEKAFTHLITKVMHDNARAVIEWLGRALEMEFMFAGL